MSYKTKQYDLNLGDNPVQSGPTKFNAEATGIFLTGDHAVYYSVMLQQLIGSYCIAKSDKDVIAINATADLINLLKSCNHE